MSVTISIEYIDAWTIVQPSESVKLLPTDVNVVGLQSR
jgi:hypothetical protein